MVGVMRRRVGIGRGRHRRPACPVGAGDAGRVTGDAERRWGVWCSLCGWEKMWTGTERPYPWKECCERCRQGAVVVDLLPQEWG